MGAETWIHSCYDGHNCEAEYQAFLRRSGTPMVELYVKLLMYERALAAPPKGEAR